jgi:uncharacterized LabA/DUF88 family protein
MEEGLSQRAAFFIDGSNFYHGLQGSGISKGDLDYYRLAQYLAKGRQIVFVEYFNCPVWPASSSRAISQQRFFSRLRTSGVKLTLGTLVERSEKCDICGNVRHFLTEKGVDIQIAISMMRAAVEDKCDVLYLLSRDADFIPAVEFVKSKSKRVFLVAPKGSKYGRLAKVCDVAIPVDQSIIDECQAAHYP